MFEPVYVLHQSFGVLTAHVFILPFVLHESTHSMHAFIDDFDVWVRLEEAVTP